MRFPPMILLIALAAVAAGCSGAPRVRTQAPTSLSLAQVGLTLAAAPDTVPDLAKFQGRIHAEGRLLIGGQPSREAMLALPGRGVTAVVNLRTPSEMENRERVPFDEAALADSLGLEYVPIPLGGKDHPYNPAAVDAFAAALQKHRGPVLLHCTVAGRASHMWAAYLVRHHGMDLQEAYARGEAMGIGRILTARLLDIELKVERVE